MTISTYIILASMWQHAMAPSTRPRVHASAAARASALQVGKSSHKGHRGLNIKDLETQHVTVA